MGSLSCRIVIKKGVAEVFNEDGTPSSLYAEALALVGNQEEALNLWATAYSQDFVAESPIIGDNAKLEDVLRFLDTQDSAKRSLTKAQRLELRGMMKENGYFSLSELQKDLVKVFKPKGKTTFKDNKTSQELYSPKEVQEVEPEEVSEVMIDIEGTLRTEDIQITPNTQGGKSLSDPTKKTPIGTSERISSEQVEREIAESIEDFSNKEEIENAVNNHPDYDALSRPSFLKKYLGMLRRLPNIIFNGVKTTEENRRTYNAVVTNALTSALPIIRAELITLNKISDATWISKEKATRKVIADLEKDLAKHGVDIIGLSNTKITRRELVEMLSSLKDHLETGGDVVVERFAEIKDLHITPRPASKVMRVNPAYDGLDIVYSENSYPDNYLFEEEGLIKIGENLYHRINREENAINDYVEALYKKVVAGELAVPTEVEDVNDPMNKEELLKDILQFAAQKSTGLKLDNPVEVALAQLVFEHEEIPAPRDINQLADITTDIEYLKGDFISDFYDYMLQEKLKNSYAYRAILQHFTFAESGITLDYEIDSIQDIEYQKELEDYIRLKRDASMNYLLKNNVGTVATEIKYLNDINSAPEFTDQVQRYKDFIVTPISNQSVIKVGGVLYTNVGSGNGVSVFSEVDMPASSYFYTEVNSEFDRADVDMIIDKQMFIFAPEKLTTEEFEQKQKDNKINTKTPKINKEALQDEKTAKALAIKLQGLDDTPTETAQEYVKSKRLGNNPQLVERVDSLLNKSTTTLVAEYLKEKLGMGISILSNSDMRKELAKRGYDSLQAMVVGEQGAQNNQEIGNKLEEAKRLLESGTDVYDIENRTGWAYRDNQWKYYSPEVMRIFKYKQDPSTLIPNAEYNLQDVLESPELFKLYPQLKNQKISFINEESKISKKYAGYNFEGLYYGGVIYVHLSTTSNKFGTRVPTNRPTTPGSKEGYLSSYVGTQPQLPRNILIAAHEVLHIIQELEGFPLGGNANTLLKEAFQILNIPLTNDNLTSINKSAIQAKILDADTSPQELSIFKAAFNTLDDILRGGLPDLFEYNKIEGEREARFIEYALNNGIYDRSYTDIRNEFERYDKVGDPKYIVGQKIQFLSTNDKVYGFYDGSTGEIYLTEEFLNSGALIHEHFHLFKPILKEQVAKGNKDAKLLLSTLTKIVDESGAFNEAEFSARYDAANRTSLEWSENRQGKGDKKILERNQAVQQSAIDLKAGRITNEQHRQNVLENSPIEPITTFYKAASEKEIREALSSEKLPKVNLPVQEGKMVALRLDIPAYKDHNTWVVTIHEAKTDKDRKGSPISLTNVARITNAVFNSSAAGALKIATKEDTKQSIIRINGNWKNFEGNTLEERGLEAEALVNEIKDNPEWVQVGTNPFRQSFFYDRANGIPVKTAEEVVQIGGLVYAKNVKYGNINDPEYTVKGLKDAAGNPVQFSAESEVYHGGDLSMGIDGPLYTSWDEKQSQAYANGNEGGLYKFGINKLNIISEDEARSVLKEEGFTPAEGWILDELNLHEIIDTRFDTSVGEDELLRFSEVLKSRGIDAIKFTDTNILTLKEDISTLVVFNTEKLTDIKMSTTLSSEAYNPRPGESKKDYLDRMREEVEANLLGDNSTEYFQRITEENNFTEAQTKTFLQRIKAFIGKFSKWIADQLGFKNITPEQAAEMTTKEALDRITTSMLRGDFGALDIKKGIDMFSIVGEVATTRSETLKASLDEAKKLEQEGINETDIEIATGWYKDQDTWKYLSREVLNDFNFKQDLDTSPGQEYNLEDVLQNNPIFEFYPELKTTKIHFYGQNTTQLSNLERSAAGFHKGGVIWVNSEFDISSAIGTMALRVGGRSVLETTSNDANGRREIHNLLALIHEIQHIIQEKEGFAVGDNPNTVLKATLYKLSLPLEINREARIVIGTQLLNENLSNDDKLLYAAAYNSIEDALNGGTGVLNNYMNLAGEREARFVDYMLQEVKKGNETGKSIITLIGDFNKIEEREGQPVYNIKLSDITPTQGFSIPRVTAIEEALAEVEATNRHTNSVAFMNSVGFKLLIKTDIKKIDNC